MKHFVGLDVSVKETSIRVVKGDGAVILQTRVPSEPQAIVDVLAMPSLERRLDGFDDRILPLYGRRMMVREIRGHLH